MYGSPTTKEIKKKYSCRPGGGAEMGNWGREDSWQGGGWQETGQAVQQPADPATSHSCIDKPGGMAGE